MTSDVAQGLLIDVPLDFPAIYALALRRAQPLGWIALMPHRTLERNELQVFVCATDYFVREDHIRCRDE